MMASSTPAPVSNADDASAKISVRRDQSYSSQSISIRRRFSGGRARSIRLRSLGLFIASQRSLRRCTLSQKSGLLPNTRARMSAIAVRHVPAVVA